jgi:hypothetical protein
MSIAHWYFFFNYFCIAGRTAPSYSISANYWYLSVRLIWHFDLKKFRPNEVPRVKISLACVFAFMAIGWPLIILKSGLAGWFKFWFMPWMVYHFWVTFSYFPPSSLKCT